MPQVKLFAYQKNLDLHCISAQEAIQNFLGFDRLKKLRRFQFWELDVDSEDAIETIVSKSYQILNPNKEGYYLNHLPESSRSDALFFVKVDRQVADSDHLVQASVSDHTGVDIHALKHTILWEIEVDMQGQSRDDVQQELVDKVVQTTARDKGLLVNPLFETFEFIEPKTIYGG